MVKIIKSLKFTMVVVFLLTGLSILKGQTKSNTSSESGASSWEELLEEMADDGLNTEELAEKLSELSENPIPLNESTKEMLESIPFLKDELIENIAYYLYRYSPIVSISELFLIDGMDEKTYRWLKPFVCIGKPVPLKQENRISSILKFGKQAFRLTFGRDLTQKAGYKTTDASSKYLGYPESLNFRYEFDFKNKYQFGILMDKDPGEFVWKKRSGGFDRISAHLSIKDLSFIKCMIFGEYKVRFGQGLICNTNFSIGKGVVGSSPESMGTELSRHFSASETNCFRGLATTIILKKIDLNGIRYPLGINLTLLGSRKLIDSNNEFGKFSTIYTTGLHRTRSEMDFRHNLMQNTIATHLTIRSINAQLGISAIKTTYNSSRESSKELWNLYKVDGTSNYNASIDWKAIWENIRIYGELASDSRRNLAGICGVTFQPANRVRLNFLGRKYATLFFAEFGNAFGVNGMVQNEKGLYSTIDFQPLKRFQIKAYYDVYKFPWMRFGVDAPSNGHESGIQIDKTNENTDVISLKVKIKYQQKNSNQNNVPIKTIENTRKEQVRLNYTKKTNNLSLKITFEGNRYKTTEFKSFGWVFAQDIGYSFKNKIQLYVHCALFKTDNYNNRIYLYEKGFPGTFSIPMLYGKGIKESLYLTIPIKSHQIKLKLDQYILPGFSSLGDGMERIDGDRRSSINMQYLCKF